VAYFEWQRDTIPCGTSLALQKISGHRLEIVIFWRIQMKDRFLMLSIKMQNLLSREEGQDLIEYALVVALIAFAATAGMTTLAKDINNAFIGIGTSLTNAVG
jgi:pilus assembly protein Flp/PilA